MTADLLIIMARYPTLGKVKTRLACDIGKAGALRIYRQLLNHHRREFRQTDFEVEWRFTPARAPFRRLARNSKPQPAGDLGGRMRRIFAESFERGYRCVVMIGTDAPTMNRPTVRQAFASLEKHSAVFQPTEDGGYALIGFAAGRARPPGAPPCGQSGRPGGPSLPDVFSDIAWSTEKVMAQTRRRLRKLGVRHAELPVTFDIDTVADLARFAQYNSRRTKKTSGRCCGRWNSVS